MKDILIILLVWNVVTFGITVYDKIAAKKWPKNRVPEKTLLALCVLGGGIGACTACYTVRHKTKKPQLLVPMVVITAVEIAVAGYLFFKG